MLVCNVISNYLTVIVIFNIMGSVSERAKVISKGLSVSPSCFGQFSNIFSILGRVLALQGNIHDDILFQLSQLFSTSWKVFSGGPRLFLVVQMTTPVTLATSHSNIFINYASLLCLQCNTHVNCPSYLLHTSWEEFPCGPRLFSSVWVSILVTLASSQIFSLITQVCLACKVILNQITCFESHGRFLESWVVFQGGPRSFWGLWVSILICAYDTTLPKGVTQRPLTGQSIWDQDSIHQPTWWEWANDTVLSKGMIQRPLIGWSIWDWDSTHRLTQWEWGYDTVLR
jgi:hypothetical protein